MRKNLQTKVIQLLQKRDLLKQQLEGEGQLMMDDEATQQKKFDEKEKRMIEMRKETEEMKEKLEKEQRAKAELAQGISILSQKLGIAQSGSDSKNLP